MANPFRHLRRSAYLTEPTMVTLPVVSSLASNRIQTRITITNQELLLLDRRRRLMGKRYRGIMRHQVPILVSHARCNRSMELK